jgi:steroid 5-alpha reductase family enzyme
MEFLWTVRLTRNYARKGGYKHEAEDYRWKTVRTNLPFERLTFPLLNFFFIAIAQNILLMMLAMPGYIVLIVGAEKALCWADVVLLECIVFLLAGQLIADDMQLRYQTGKVHHSEGTATVDNAYREFTPTELERGFVTKGLWAYSRHPAFLCEQLIWLCIYLYSVVASGVWFNWTGLGILSLIILFQASTVLTERISANKYPQYKEYQTAVGMLIPLPGYRWNESKYAKKVQ